METDRPKNGFLLVLGNLLLDMVATVEDSYLDAFNLVPDSIQTANGSHLKIYTEIMERPGVVISPGGSALNTVRMAQKILNFPDKIALIGAVGSDKMGQLLVDTVEKEGVKLLAQKIKGETVTTGRCACLLTRGGSHRTMITDLGAALKFCHETWLEDKRNLEWAEKANFVYVTGYFLKVSAATAMEVAKKVKERDVPIILNLNSVWVTKACKKEIEDLLPFVDILFGNEEEVKSFAAEIALNSDINQISETACSLSLLMKEKSGAEYLTKSRSVIVTRGELPVICSENGDIQEYPVPCVSKDELVDTTGAGDAFVGGFLACYVQGKSVNECISCGIWAATEELKGYGFILPPEVPEQFKTE